MRVAGKIVRHVEELISRTRTPRWPRFTSFDRQKSVAFEEEFVDTRGARVHRHHTRLGGAECTGRSEGESGLEKITTIHSHGSTSTIYNRGGRMARPNAYEIR
jgi:hypothetical protein